MHMTHLRRPAVCVQAVTFQCIQPFGQLDSGLPADPSVVARQNPSRDLVVRADLLPRSSDLREGISSRIREQAERQPSAFLHACGRQSSCSETIRWHQVFEMFQLLGSSA